MQDTITRRLQQEAGLDGDAAASVASAIVRTLVEQLPVGDRSTFLGKLPVSVALAGRGATGAVADSVAEFYARAGASTGLSNARVVEATQIVCAALVELLDPDVRVWLAARLPSALSEWLSPAERASRTPEPPHGQRRYPTLAEGRPGSTHPLSEGHLDRAHHASIALSDNPHGDTKLASSPGSTQTREHETLSEADPRPARPLSTGKQ